MRVLLFHTHYQQPGGEDSVFAAETSLLQEMGHEVLVYTLHNRALEGMPKARAVLYTTWNPAVYRELRQKIKAFRPQVVHIHNTFPLASPSVIHAAKAEKTPVVMTLHNYRLLCVNALLFREGQICEECLGRLPWPGVLHGCYRDSHAASGAVALMLTAHRALGTWTRTVDVYIALTEFARSKFIEGGLPANKIAVKPNFIYPDPGAGKDQGGYALFVGRLSQEKGLDTLIAAWKHVGKQIPLKIVGDGPLASKVAMAAEQGQGVEWLGWRQREEIIRLMKRANFLVFPSEWYEGFPMTIAEAYATGLPVVASNLGAMASLVDHGRTGLHFRPGDPNDLAAKVEWLLSNPVELSRMRKEARAEYEAKYTAERNHKMLMEIYQRAIENAKR
ncbi:MAG: glycosyltransferase family 4 protein [Gammaproteobacteria bacterium]|nr:glycosyltransferase family 4 protein [Gammaproteobacteria bacterium]